MTNVAHKNLTGVDLHEPKGIAGLAANKYYVSDGANSGAWTAIPVTPLVKIATATASTSATLDFQHGATVGGSVVVFDGTYSGYEFHVRDLVSATDDVGLHFRVGTGGTPTYQTTNYSYSAAGNSSSGGAVYSFSGSLTTQITFNNFTGSNGISNVASEGGMACFVRIGKPSTTQYHPITWHSTYFSANVGAAYMSGSGVWVTTTALTAVRFFLSSGNIASGTITMYGVL